MQIRFTHLLKEYWQLHLAMVSLVIAVFLNQLSTGIFAFKYYDTAFRLAIFTPILWITLAIPLKYLKKVQWAFMVGVFGTVIKTYVITEGGTVRPPNIGFLATIPFSGMALLFGAIVIVSIGWTEHRNKLLIVLKILVGLIGVYITILSQTRGSWIAIPFFIMGIFIFSNSLRSRHRIAILVLVVSALALFATFSNVIQNRLTAAKADVSMYVNNKSEDTSLGIRLQLWNASLQLFKENPFFGVGRAHFIDGLKVLCVRKVISLTTTSYSHSHNEILFNMATLGLFGLLGIISIYFIPAYYFARELNQPDRELRTTAGMGLTVCLGFLILGLTDMMFFWNVTGGIYSMSIATFFACVIKRKKELKWIAP
ncbi:MAG: O-antigen ligase family protein [Glaciimonas sp.]|nr:O-antigen ligase family protein [Glaciimonas sp.]